MFATVNPFLAGVGLGAAFSLVGALLSYWLGLRHSTERTPAPLVYLFLTVLVLGLIGAGALITGIFTGSFVQGLICGLGVLVGFSMVFALLMFAYLMYDDNS